MIDLDELERKARAARRTDVPEAEINRYDHGGGRLFLNEPAGGRNLIADFYGEGPDREFYLAANPSVILELIERVRAAEAG